MKTSERRHWLPCSVSIVNFDQVNTGWIKMDILSLFFAIRNHSGGKKCFFFGKFCVLTKFMIPCGHFLSQKFFRVAGISYFSKNNLFDL